MTHYQVLYDLQVKSKPKPGGILRSSCRKEEASITSVPTS